MCGDRQLQPVQVVAQAEQLAVSCVGFQLFAAHAVEQLVQVDVLTSVNPLPLRVDLRVGLNRSDYCRCGQVYVTGLLDDSFESRPHVPLPLLE